MSARPDRQDLTVDIRAARLLVALGAAALTVAVSGCTAGPGATTPSSSPSELPQKPSSSSTSAPTVTIAPVLVVASVDVDGKHVTASGYVQGIISDSGTCTYRFTHAGSSDVVVDNAAVADRATTSCGAVQPDIAQFPRGTWQVTLAYTSNGAEYVSEPVRLEVP